MIADRGGKCKTKFFIDNAAPNGYNGAYPGRAANLRNEIETLYTRRLVLRGFTREDAADVFAWASDERVTKFLSFRPHRSLEATKEALAQWIAAYGDGDHYGWAIELGGRVIGRIHTNYVSRRHRRCELGYYIGHDHWNRGLASEALRGVLAYLFHSAGMHRVEAVYEPGNPASGRVMEKCGMRYEGTMRQFFLCRDGTYEDGLLYAILKDEFNQ